jgi:hypothetical protein
MVYYPTTVNVAQRFKLVGRSPTPAGTKQRAPYSIEKDQRMPRRLAMLWLNGPLDAKAKSAKVAPLPLSGMTLTAAV